VVTGSEGFIGSHLTEALVERGHNVRAVVQYNSLGACGWLDTIDKGIRDQIEIVQGDVRDFDCMSKAIAGKDSVIHLAALIGIPYSYVAPRSYIDVNVSGTLNVMQACVKHEIERVVHTSTSEVYGTAQQIPIDEKHPLHAQSPYAASKVAADQIAISFAASFNLPVVILRPFNVFGPRQSLRAVIPSIITQLGTRQQFLELGSLHPTRDFNYVNDTVSAFLAAVNSDAGIGEVFNIGSGFEISIERLAELLMKIVGKNVEIRLDRKRERPMLSEVDRLVSDSSRATEVLGWSPRRVGVAGLEEALIETNAWYRLAENRRFYQMETFQF